MLLGRRAETDRVDALIRGAKQGQGGALVIRGEPGVGKTALLRFAACADGMQLLSAAGVESESELPYSGMADLLRPILGKRLSLPASQRAALESALALGPAIGAERFAVQLGALGLIAAAAESRPVLALVDDLQWVDRASAASLFFIARRLSGTSVAVLFAARAVAAVPGTERIPDVCVGGLALEDSRRLLADASGRKVPRDIATRLHQQTGGNPLALTELVALLAPPELEGRVPLPDPLPVGVDLENAFASLLDALPADTTAALVLAAANDGEDAATVALALAELNLLPASLDSAEASSVITRMGDKLAFRHPLIRAAAYQHATPDQRRAAHRALAAALTDESHRDRRAWHLAASAIAPDPAIADELERASERARDRGSSPAAAAALERAARLTPDPQRRAIRLVAAAELWEQSGMPERAIALSDEAATEDGPLQARRIHVRARVAMWRGRPDDARDLLVTAARNIETVAPSDAAAMLLDASAASQMSGDCARALDIARRARELVNSTGNPLDAACNWALAQALCVAGKTDEALPLARHVAHRALELPEHAAHPLLAYIPTVLHFCEDHAAARDLAILGISQARTHGLLKLLPFALACLALIDHQTGRWTQAHAAASESVDLARELTLETQEGYSLLSLAFVEVGFGREAIARRCIDQTLAAAKRFGTESLALGASTALGQLEMSLARPDAAIVTLERAVMLGRRQHVGQPLIAPCHPEYIEALLQLGRRTEAMRALDEFDAQVQAADSAWGRATAERCRAMLADDGGALTLFERALELHTATPTPFDRARTELRFGEALRRHRRPGEARVHLRAALDEFERLGAGRWMDQVVVALAAAGERVVAPREPILARLTPQEMQVCLAVAEGATNREVAARLFLSHKTIETHLSNAYRKIGVRSRTELATLVARHATNGPVSERDPAHAT